MLTFYGYSKCTTCQKAQHWLDSHGIAYRYLDIKTEHPDVETMEVIYRKSGLPLKRFFNTSGMLYREMELSQKLPAMTEDEQLALLAADGMLIKRPLLIGEDFAVPGFREKEWTNALHI